MSASPETYPQATLTDRRFELPIIAAKLQQSPRCKTMIAALQKHTGSILTHQGLPTQNMHSLHGAGNL